MRSLLPLLLISTALAAQTLQRRQGDWVVKTTETVENQSIILAGNLIVLVLEGLVVSIQTTRLILFEFFIRFLTAEGRPFRPLAAPASTFIERSPA